MTTAIETERGRNLPTTELAVLLLAQIARDRDRQQWDHRAGAARAVSNAAEAFSR